MYRKEFVELMNATFAVKDKVEWYRRRRVDRDGNRDVHRMQLVLKFLPGAFVEPIPPPIVGVPVDVPLPASPEEDKLLETLIIETLDDANDMLRVALAHDSGC
jgi:hypothetical protein